MPDVLRKREKFEGDRTIFFQKLTSVSSCPRTFWGEGWQSSNRQGWRLYEIGWIAGDRCVNVSGWQLSISSATSRLVAQEYIKSGSFCTPDYHRPHSWPRQWLVAGWNLKDSATMWWQLYLHKRRLSNGIWWTYLSPIKLIQMESHRGSPQDATLWLCLWDSKNGERN